MRRVDPVLPARSPAMRLRRWLKPGIGVKRWLLLVFAGMLLLSLGVAHVIRQVNLEPGGVAQTAIDLVTLQFLSFPVRGLIAGGLGAVLVVIGTWRAARAITEPLRLDEETPLFDVIYQKRFLARGPRIVAIGGGTGLSTLLRGLKEHSSNLTAIVTVADDGGSSGTLREELGIPPVGDIRNCIAALADAEPLMSELLGYRFPGGTRIDGGPVATARGGLGGHPVGNLLLAAMTALEGGDFEEGVRRMNRVLAVRGQRGPGFRDADQPRRPHEGGRHRQRPVEDHADGGHRARLDRAQERQGLPGRHRRHRRLPRSSCSGPAASTRASCRSC